VITDTDGTIQYVNPAFERVNGYTSDEAIGRTPVPSNPANRMTYSICEVVGDDHRWRGLEKKSL